MEWLHYIQSEAEQLGPWSYLILLLLVMVEGPIATLFGAAAAHAQVLKWQWVFAVAALGNLTADALWYLLGHMGRIDLIYRFTGWIGIRPQQVHEVETRLRADAVRVLVMAKLTAGFMIPSLIGAGILKIPLRRWFFPVLLAETLWTGTLIYLGFHAVQWIAEIEQGLQLVALVGGTLFILLVFHLIRKQHKD